MKKKIFLISIITLILLSSIIYFFDYDTSKSVQKSPPEWSEIHPKLLFNSSEIPMLRQKVSDGGPDDETFQKILAYSNNLLYNPNSEFIDKDGSKMDDLLILGLSYQLLEDSNQKKLQYGNKCKLVTEYITDNQNFDNNQYEDSIELKWLIFGYDWCYDLATEEERNLTRDKIIDYIQSGLSTAKYSYFAKILPRTDNKMVMMASMLGTATILLSDEINKTLLNQSLETSDKIINTSLTYVYGEDGAYYEGILYSAWTMRFLTTYMESRERYDGYSFDENYPSINGLKEWYTYDILPITYLGDAGYTNDMNDDNFYAEPLPSHNSYLDWALYKYQDSISSYLWDHSIGEYGIRLNNSLSDEISTILWYQNIPSENPINYLPNSKIFKGRGEYYYRTGWPDTNSSDDVQFVLYSGKFYTGAHANEDQNQILLTGYGDRLIIDSGGKDKPRKTEYHNAILINGLGQSRAGDGCGTDGNITEYYFTNFSDYLHGDAKFAYSNHSEFNTNDYPEPGANWSQLGCDQYHNIVENADRHVLTIKNDNNNPYFAIIDDIKKNDSVNTYSLFLHTEPNYLFDYASNPIIIDGDSANLEIFFVNPGFNDMTLEQHNPTYHTNRLNATINTVNPYYFYILYPRLKTSVGPAYNILQAINGYGVSIEFPDHTDKIFYRNESVLSFQDLKTNARLTLIKTNTSSDITEFSMIDGSYLNDSTKLVEVNGGIATVINSEKEITISDKDLTYVVYAPSANQVTYENETHICEYSSIRTICSRLSEDSPYVFIDFSAESNYEQFQINLEKGINTISLPLLLPDYSIESILGDILENVTAIYSYKPSTGWQVYSTNPKIPNTLTSLEKKKGYFVDMKHNSTLTIFGEPLNLSNKVPQIDLEPGWNFIGLHNTTPQQINNIINTDFNFTTIWKFEKTNNNYTEINYNTDYFEPGNAYWIYLREPEQYSPKSFLKFLKQIFF